jgi:molecular chaperone GrpE
VRGMENEKELVVKSNAGESEGSATNGPESRASAGAAASAPATSDLVASLETLRAEKAELYDRLLRKQAELENFRKRTQREKEEFRQRANEDLIRVLLPVLDSFERALKHGDADLPESIFEGMKLIYRQLREALVREGLVVVESEGKLFDPHLHQAIERVEDADRQDQEIIEEVQRGYRLGRHLLRPAIVKVAVRPRKEEPSQPPEDKSNTA